MNVSLLKFEDPVMEIEYRSMLLVLVLAREARKWDGDILRNDLGEGSHIP